jgi:hypothetical protein
MQSLNQQEKEQSLIVILLAEVIQKVIIFTAIIEIISLLF